MRLKIVAALFVTAVVVAIGLLRREAPAPPPIADAASVVLVGDLAEADEPCVCGQYIRAVRALARRGMPTTEVDPATAPAEAARYRVSAIPAVIIFDARGTELRRFEGESARTLAAMQAQLAALPERSP